MYIILHQVGAKIRQVSIRVKFFFIFFSTELSTIFDCKQSEQKIADKC